MYLRPELHEKCEETKLSPGWILTEDKPRKRRPGDNAPLIQAVIISIRILITGARVLTGLFEELVYDITRLWSRQRHFWE